MPEEFGVECVPIKVDLSAGDMLEQVVEAVGDREVGLMVYNAAHSDLGPYYKPTGGLGLEKARIAVNVSGPMLLTYRLAKPMLAKRAGGILLMTSGTGFQGCPYYSAYAATRAYCINLGESLWHEFKPYNVHVLAVAAGMTLSSAAEGMKHINSEMLQTTEEVVDEAMNAFGEQPLCIPGEYNRFLREQMDQLTVEQQITTMADHPATHFLGGRRPTSTSDNFVGQIGFLHGNTSMSGNGRVAIAAAVRTSVRLHLSGLHGRCTSGLLGAFRGGLTSVPLPKTYSGL